MCVFAFFSVLFTGLSEELEGKQATGDKRLHIVLLKRLDTAATEQQRQEVEVKNTPRKDTIYFYPSNIC